jgi:hypothetical protein
LVLTDSLPSHTGSLANNHKYIAEQLGIIFSKWLLIPYSSQPLRLTSISSSEAAQSKSPLAGKRSSWPGTETVLQLARINHKLVVHDNPVGLSVDHLIDVPIKKLPTDETWLVLRGLKNKWIQLVEHQFDSLPRSTTVRKGKAPAAKPTVAREEEDEDEDDDDDDYEEEDDDDDDNEDKKEDDKEDEDDD